MKIIVSAFMTAGYIQMNLMLLLIMDANTMKIVSENNQEIPQSHCRPDPHTINAIREMKSK